MSVDLTSLTFPPLSPVLKYTIFITFTIYSVFGLNLNLFCFYLAYAFLEKGASHLAAYSSMASSRWLKPEVNPLVIILDISITCYLDLVYMIRDISWCFLGFSFQSQVYGFLDHRFCISSWL